MRKKNFFPNEKKKDRLIRFLLFWFAHLRFPFSDSIRFENKFSWLNNETTIRWSLGNFTERMTRISMFSSLTVTDEEKTRSTRFFISFSSRSTQSERSERKNPDRNRDVSLSQPLNQNLHAHSIFCFFFWLGTDRFYRRIWIKILRWMSFEMDMFIGIDRLSDTRLFCWTFVWLIFNFFSVWIIDETKKKKQIQCTDYDRRLGHSIQLTARIFLNNQRIHMESTPSFSTRIDSIERFSSFLFHQLKTYTIPDLFYD